jgi:hypothetical protein
MLLWLKQMRGHTKLVNLQHEIEWSKTSIGNDFHFISEQFFLFFIDNWIQPMTSEERKYMRGLAKDFPNLL